MDASAAADAELTPLQLLIVEKIFIGFMPIEQLAAETGYTKRGIALSMRSISGARMMKAAEMLGEARLSGTLGQYHVI